MWRPRTASLSRFVSVGFRHCWIYFTAAQLGLMAMILLGVLILLIMKFILLLFIVLEIKQKDPGSWIKSCFTLLNDSYIWTALCNPLSKILFQMQIPQIPLCVFLVSLEVLLVLPRFLLEKKKSFLMLCSCHGLGWDKAVCAPVVESRYGFKVLCLSTSILCSTSNPLLFRGKYCAF